MPNSTITGDDEAHDLSKEEKDVIEKKLREDARAERKSGNAKSAQEKNNRAKGISRKPSNRAQHH